MLASVSPHARVAGDDGDGDEEEDEDDDEPLAATTGEGVPE
jgi:hypothetical protein